MSGSVWGGIVLITLFSLTGIGLLMAIGLFGRVPQRWRPAATTVLQMVGGLMALSSAYVSAERFHSNLMARIVVGLALLLVLLGAIQIIRTVLNQGGAGGADA